MPGVFLTNLLLPHLLLHTAGKLAEKKDCSTFLCLIDNGSYIYVEISRVGVLTESEKHLLQTFTCFFNLFILH